MARVSGSAVAVLTNCVSVEPEALDCFNCARSWQRVQGRRVLTKAMTAANTMLRAQVFVAVLRISISLAVG
jgi:hypothetical protein